MKLIEPQAELITESDPFKKIELVGRTCYKSQDRIKEGSDKKFFNMLMKNKHWAMFEHAVFIFKINTSVLFNDLKQEKFINTTENEVRRLVSGNLRAWLELDDPFINYAIMDRYPEMVTGRSCISNNSVEWFDGTLFIDEIPKHSYTTIKFTCDRGVSHELVRHRLFSFAQESTRYCNYSKSKNSTTAEMIKPSIKFITPKSYNEWDVNTQTKYAECLQTCENCYMELTELGLKPEEARGVLPNALATEIVVTGNDEEWQHFFDLRLRETTGKAHPDMKKLALLASLQYPSTAE